MLCYVYQADPKIQSPEITTYRMFIFLKQVRK